MPWTSFQDLKSPIGSVDERTRCQPRLLSHITRTVIMPMFQDFDCLLFVYDYMIPCVQSFAVSSQNSSYHTIQSVYLNVSLSTVAVAAASSLTKPASARNFWSSFLPSHSINYFIQETRSAHFKFKQQDSRLLEICFETRCSRTKIPTTSFRKTLTSCWESVLSYIFPSCVSSMKNCNRINSTYRSEFVSSNNTSSVMLSLKDYTVIRRILHEVQRNTRNIKICYCGCFRPN